MVLGFWLHHDECDLDVGSCMQMDLTDPNSWRTTILWPNWTDQRFLLARGFVICDVSALIDHNLLHGCISRPMMWILAS
jgi:hypothetical protein